MGLLLGPMMLVGVIVGIVFLVALVVAPFKLYGIHDELRKTNRTLAAQNEILTSIAAEIHFGAMPAAQANVRTIPPAVNTPPPPVMGRHEAVSEFIRQTKA
jgi:hypothetical protein